ncbi:MAG: hypothetical protein PVI23_11965 [Maricaulaceae bacterium]|jgi:hypothetical protein
MKTHAAAAFAATCLLASAAFAQDDYAVPRTPHGHPDFQGIWMGHALLPLEARPGVPELVVSEERAREIQAEIVEEIETLPFNHHDPEVPQIARDAEGMAVVRGERRTRQLVEPADGRLPLTPAARREIDQLDSFFSTYINPPVLADNPEERPVWERCIAMEGRPPFTSAHSPHPRRIVQTADHVVIHTEYGDEARIIPFTDTHGPAVLRPHLGDSIARWEGDTLVIETVHLQPKDRMRYFPHLIVPSTSTVVEKYTRLSDDELLYQYTIIDPATYTEPWLAEYSIYRTDQQMYEFACHEGNYSLPNIMAAERERERRGEPPRVR